MADALRSLPLGLDATRSVLPTSFNWTGFCAALALIAAPLAHAGWRLTTRAIARPITCRSGMNHGYDLWEASSCSLMKRAVVGGRSGTSSQMSFGLSSMPRMARAAVEPPKAGAQLWPSADVATVSPRG